MSNTYYHFLSTVRQGLASRIRAKSDNKKRAEVELNVYLKARGKDSGAYEIENRDINVQLYGPGDVIGFPPKIIARTEPQSGTYDFEPNYFPFVEFQYPDFAWRFSPHPPEIHNGTTYVRPWLVLVVLESGLKNDDEEFKNGDTEFIKIRQSTPDLPGLIKVHTKSLPNLEHNWRWAHVQLNGEETMGADQFAAILKSRSELASCRLMCPRRLKPNQKYACFVLPSSELGRFSGISKTPPDDKSAFELAWKEEEGEIETPFYYTWEFHTGASGDFEHLVRLLEARKLEKIGVRPVDFSKPGYGVSGVYRSINAKPEEVNTLEMEGALQSLDTRYSPWGMDPYLEIEETEIIYNVELRVDPSRNSVDLSWQTAAPGQMYAKYGDSELSAPITSILSTQKHSVQLNNLKAGTEYNLEIGFHAIGETEPIHINGKFKISPDSDIAFQKDLAPLINRPIAEDLALEKFEILLDSEQYDWLESFEAKLLQSGSKVQVNCKTSFLSTLKLSVRYYNPGIEGYSQKAIEDLNSALDHVCKLSELLPGKTYHLKIIARNQEDVPFQTDEIDFTMPPLPSVVPPIYGRWHFGKHRIKEDKKSLVDPLDQKYWIDQLNLDPRHRSVASLGTQVIRKNQEDLMAAAWDQFGSG
jgi:hypothetical protein